MTSQPELTTSRRRRVATFPVQKPVHRRSANGVRDRIPRLEATGTDVDAIVDLPQLSPDL